MKLEIVCIVEYMSNKSEGLRQSVFKGIRNDKNQHDCIVTKE